MNGICWPASLIQNGQVYDVLVGDGLSVTVSQPVSVTVTLAHIAGFDYGNLKYRQLATRGWDAYSRDVFFVSY